MSKPSACGFTKAFAPMDKLIQDKVEKEMEKRGLN